MKNISYVGFFSNFTNKTKLGIITSLVSKPLTVGEISKKTGVEQSNVSHNLSVLLDCNLVSCRREGKKRIYSLNKETVFPLLRIAKGHTKCNCSSSCKRGCC